MSKNELKKYLNQFSKEQVIDILLEQYSKNKELKKHFDFIICPNVTQTLEEYKKIILNEYYPTRGIEKTRISVCKKAISDFQKLNPGVEVVAELMVFFIETACSYTWEYGDMIESFYTSMEKNFDRTMQYLSKYGLIEEFQPNITQILKYASVCGYGFCDTMPEIAAEYGADIALDKKAIEEEYTKLHEI